MNQWCHMEYCSDVLTVFLWFDYGMTFAVYGGSKIYHVLWKICNFFFSRWMKVLWVWMIKRVGNWWVLFLFWWINHLHNVVAYIVDSIGIVYFSEYWGQIMFVKTKLWLNQIVTNGGNSSSGALFVMRSEMYCSYRKNKYILVRKYQSVLQEFFVFYCLSEK